MTCGHTHLPLIAEQDGVLYVNSGTWTEAPPCPFVVVDGKEIRLDYWPRAVGSPESTAVPVEAAAPDGSPLPSPQPALGG
ncbi:MAG: hypothetical protein U0790_24150 [Isosphaeraceae bacterium]